MHRPLTPRVLILLPLLIFANAWWLVEVEYVRYTDNFTTLALFFNAIALLVILLGINRLLRRARPRWMFSPAEMVALYVAVVVATNLAGHDMLQILFTTLTYPFRYATPETGWTTSLLPNLPSHLVVHDQSAVDALYTGNTTLYRWDHILPWLAPVGAWTLFTMLLVWTTLCLTTLFRRQWESERLSYPLAEIPLQMIDDEKGLFRTPALWAGVAIGAVCQVVNVIHALFPAVPGIPTGVQNYVPPELPWSATGVWSLSFFPFAFGLAFLLPTQLSFSCWFFYLINKLELVLAATVGYTEPNKFPYIDQQGVGAGLGLFLVVLWAARGHLARVWRSAISGRKAEMDDAGEPMSYRVAVFGLLGGVAGMVWFATTAGMGWLTAVYYLAILLIVVVVLARLRAELGVPTYALAWSGGDEVLQRVAGTRAWSQGDLNAMALFFWLTRTSRQLPMQSQVDAVHLGRRTDTNARSLAALVLGASFLGIVAAFWAFLHSAYKVGYESAKFQGPALWAFGKDPWQRWTAWTHSPAEPDHGTAGAYLFGLAFTLFLSLMRSRFIGWPFHPAGFLIGTNFGVFRIGVPIFVSWLLKALILRYGGLKTYRRALPFFIGLILGEFGAGFVRTVLDLMFGLYLPPSTGIGGL